MHLAPLTTQSVGAITSNASVQKASSNAGAKGKAKPKGGKKPSKKANNSKEPNQAEESDDFLEQAANAEESGDDSDREVSLSLAH